LGGGQKIHRGAFGGGDRGVLLGDTRGGYGKNKERRGDCKGGVEKLVQNQHNNEKARSSNEKQMGEVKTTSMKLTIGGSDSLRKILFVLGRTTPGETLGALKKSIRNGVVHYKKGAWQKGKRDWYNEGQKKKKKKSWSKGKGGKVSVSSIKLLGREETSRHNLLIGTLPRRKKNKMGRRLKLNGRAAIKQSQKTLWGFI